jgi:hypothetical protein
MVSGWSDFCKGQGTFFTGRFAAGGSCPYYADAAMGGQRGITVKDQLGVRRSFGYRVPVS